MESAESLKFDRFLKVFPKELHELILKDQMIYNMIRLCFENGASLMETYVNIILFSFYDRDKLKDLLIEKESNRKQPIFYKMKSEKEIAQDIWTCKACGKPITAGETYSQAENVLYHSYCKEK